MNQDSAPANPGPSPTTSPTGRGTRPRLPTRLAAALLFAGSAALADPSQEPSFTWTPSFSLTSDALSTRGGASAGSVVLGRAEAHVLVDFGARRSLVLDSVAILGGDISSRVGDAQGVSNIEGPRSLRVLDLFAQGPVGAARGVGRVGLIDLNAFFYVQGDAAGNFLNSSHGIGPEFSHSSPQGPSVYPNATVAAVLEQPVAATVVRLGAFAASPNTPGANGAAFNAASHGALLVGEIDAGPARGGLWGYTASLPQRTLPSGGHGDAGAYAILEGQPSRSVGTWLTAGVSSAAFNPVNSYVGGGFTIARGDLTWGAAVASAGLPGAGRRETNVELTFIRELPHGLSLQPDLQRITNPSGQGGTAWVAGIRLRYEFNGVAHRHQRFIRRHRVVPE